MKNLLREHIAILLSLTEASGGCARSQILSRRKSLEFLICRTRHCVCCRNPFRFYPSVVPSAPKSRHDKEHCLLSSDHLS